jgi:ABC-type glycerol-3-phosphate transport system substrate-binding protein
MEHFGISRRNLLKTTALAAASAVSAPYVRHSYAAGKLALGVWDHWVPGANDTFTKLCKEWGDKNKVEIQIDYITSQGDKDLLTASAEAQARTGHDIMSHRAWQVAVHRRVLEPLDDVVNSLIKQYGPISPVSEYLAKHDGVWHGVPTTVGSQVKPCCSRIDLYKQYCGLDLTQIFPANDQRDPKLVATWTWDTYLKTAGELHKAGYPVGLPMGQTSDSVDWVGAVFNSFGAMFADAKDNIKINSAETRAALEYLKKLMPLNPPEVFAWDDAGNNRWLISGKGSSIMNPPSAWSVAKRDHPEVAKNCWTHDMPAGPKGRFVGQLPFFYGLWAFSANKSAAKDLLLFLSQKESARALVAVSNGYDLPSFKSMYDFDTWKTVEPPLGTVYNYPPRGDEQTSITGYPARPDVASQIYNQAVPTILVAKVTQGNEPIDTAIKWAEKEIEGFLRA